MPAHLVRKLLLSDRLSELARRERLYAADPDRAQIERHQVESFNRIWQYCLNSVPFYVKWAKEHDLPPQLSDIAELRDFPHLTKRILTNEAHLVFDDTSTRYYLTGGSSGTPARFPRGPGEELSNYADIYTTRGWWGIRPFDPYVHLWGHYHLTGNTLGRAKRRLLDAVAGATRLNAYDMTEETMGRHLQTLRRSDPVYIVGYTSSLFKLARRIEARSTSLALRRLRAVILTAETVTDADVTLVSRVFGVPVINEYGAAETGVMAASRGESASLQVLWASRVVQLTNEGNIRVTTLNDRLFPLINYEIGDQAVPGDMDRGNALTLASIRGRTQDFVHIRNMDGTVLEISAMLPVHILKLEPRVTAVQFRQKDDYLQILIVASGPLDLPTVARTFASRLRKDHPDFDQKSIRLAQIDSPALTKAGKQALFIE